MKAGDAATYTGEAFGFLRPGGTVFVRSVDDTTAYVQNPWDSHERTIVDLTDLTKVVR